MMATTGVMTRIMMSTNDDEDDDEDDVDEGDDVFDLLLPYFAFYYLFLVTSATWSII